MASARYARISSDASRFELFHARGMALAGIPNAHGTFWDDFNEGSSVAPLKYTNGGGGSGTHSWTNPTDKAGGVHQILTGASAGSSFDSFVEPYTLATQGTSRWYMAARLKVTTAVTAQSKAVLVLHNETGTNSVGFGFYGPSNATRLVLVYDGTYGGAMSHVILLPVDTNWHVLEAYCRGDGVIRGRIDNGAEVSATMSAAAANPSRPVFTVRNGTDAANVAMDRDWVMLLYPAAL